MRKLHLLIAGIGVGTSFGGSTSADVVTYAEYTFEGTPAGVAAALDVSGNARHINNGTAGNTYHADTRPGSTGSSSVQFANAGFYGMDNIPGGFLPTDNIGFEGWFKAANASEANVHIFGMSSNGNGMSIAQNGAVWTGLHGGVKWLTNTTTPVNTAEWIHLAAVRDNGVTKIYANGRFVGSDGGGLNTALHPPHLAVNSGGAVRYDGLADDLRIHTFNAGEFNLYDSNYFSGSHQNMAYRKPARSNGTGTGLAANYSNPNWGSDGITAAENTGNFVEMPYGALGVLWEVDLATVANVTEINILPRSGFDARMENIRVSVFNGTTETIIGDYNTTGPPTGELRISGLSQTAERVRITKIGPTTGDGAPNTLNLSEVEVIGTSIVNPNLPPSRINVASVRNNPNAVATQSSTYNSGQNPLALRAIDGITDPEFNNGSVTHTAGSDAGWWNVDLGDDFLIDEVVLYNRNNNQDRLGNFRLSVFLGGIEVYFNDQVGAIGSMQSYIIPNISGDAVQIALNGTNPQGNTFLSLAEVEVYGTLQAIPEPSITGLLLLGGALLAATARRISQV